MHRKLGFILVVAVVVFGLMFTASCSKKQIKTEPSVSGMYEDSPLIRQPITTTPSEKEDTGLVRRQKAIDEERLRQERLQREEAERIRREREGERVVIEERGSRTSFMSEDVYFSYDSAALSAQARETLKNKAEWLRTHPNISVIIEGHCDERGTNAYNMALGDRRAESVKAFLANLGISRSRMTTISYGEERPADPSHNERAWRRNRRAHFVLQ